MIPFASPYQVLRSSSAQTYDHGRLVPPVQGMIQIMASIQPLSGKDLKLFPEGRGDVGLLSLWTETPLVMASQTQEMPTDQVIYQGEIWEPIKVEPWEALIPHYKYIIERKGAYNG